MKIEQIVTDMTKQWSGINSLIIPDKINKVNLYFFGDEDKDTLARLLFCYPIIWNSSVGNNTETMDIKKGSYIVVNDEKTFYMCDKQDVTELYSWLTGTDFNKRVKELKEFGKKQKIAKDF
jgi:hypothetical protein